MCGLAGFLASRAPAWPTEPGAVLGRMTATLGHRGPDSAGTWLDESAGIGLGHRRLAIVDLSDEGRQPMLSASGRYVVAYNGEIYNFRSVQRDLEGRGHRFRGRSDTEVMLAAIEAYGIEGALGGLAGMFAFALWDRETRSLHLGRDRLGKKPLYVALCRGAVLFASELKAFHAFPGFSPGIDRGALALFLRHGYVPDPYCIYEAAMKLPPASLLTLGLDDIEVTIDGLRRRTRAYWSALEAVQRGQADPLRVGEREATDELDRSLRLAVAERMIADVPLGAFLSGGIDSSTVVALMQAQSSRPVRTFTVGFEHAAFNEADDARRVARHLGTDHTELLVTPREAQDVVPRLAEIYDEPFADSSQIPTFLVARLARRHVTVALSGDGGDESFGGYNRYIEWSRLARFYRWPHAARRTVAQGLTALSPARWDAVLAGLRAVLPASLGQVLWGERLHKLADFLPLSDAESVYCRAVSLWADPAAVVIGGDEPPMLQAGFDRSRLVAGVPSRMMYLDTVGYLPGDILVKVDRASMAVSLEARCPLLDHRVVELAWRLPLCLKLRGKEGKWLLREVLARYLPRPLFERPKQGFGPPLGDWLKGPLRGWAEELLDEARLRREGFLDPLPVRRAWAEHLTGARSWSYRLWSVLMFQAWHQRWRGAGD